jgi:hypothetical protein
MNEKLPKATHMGELKIGDVIIPCAVLDNGTRVLSEHGITTAFGSRSGASKKLKRTTKEGGALLPVFVASQNVLPFISKELYAGLSRPIEYETGNRSAWGFPAELLPQICDVWLTARAQGVTKVQQEQKCQQAEVLMRGLAHVGIIALVDEATGYQDYRARKALEQILDKFIAKELSRWAKTFPDEFYENMFRLRHWPYDPKSVKRPSVIGRYTEDLVYKRLAPGVLEQLKELNPVDEKGRRKHKHFQWLTQQEGYRRLMEHLAAVVALMKASSTWNRFYGSMQRALPQYGETIEMFPELWGKDDDEE